MKIFIADYLPLANKGEEEILRGIETLFKNESSDSITFSVFGDVDEIQQIGNVTVYPKNICYPIYKYSGKIKTLLDILKSLLDGIGIYQYKRNILNDDTLINDLKNSDKILIGHDGFFNLRCAQLGNFLYKKGLHYGILGAGFSKPGKKVLWAYNMVYKKCFDNADYVVLRERTAFNYVKEISKNKCIQIFPDPAFFCPSNDYNTKNVADVISKYEIGKEGKLNVGMTICEDSISFSRAFMGTLDKVAEHRKFIAEIMSIMSEKYNCTFFFLPHCIKEGKGNDLLIAKDIKTRVGNTVDCKIIEEDMPVLDLKYLISRMDLMIGERTHSIINSIATTTPFVSLTCSADFRTHDIVGDGCGLPKQIFDLDNPNVCDLIEVIDTTIKGKSELIGKLQVICNTHEEMKFKLQQIL